MVVMVRCVHCTTWSLCTLRLVERVARPGESDPCPGPGLEAKVIKKQKWVPFEMTESILKMSECQTKAGNQECFEKLENLKTWKLKNSKTLKTLKMILGTCWTTFVFMSMLKSHCLLSKIVMLFWDLSLSITLSYEFRCHSSQLKCLNGRQELGTWSSLSLVD